MHPTEKGQLIEERESGENVPRERVKKLPRPELGSSCAAENAITRKGGRRKTQVKVESSGKEEGEREMSEV